MVRRTLEPMSGISSWRWSVSPALIANRANTRDRLRPIEVLIVFVILIAGAGCASTAAPAGPTPGGEWPSLTLNSSNSLYQSQSTITSANVGQISQQWFYPTPDPVTSTPVVQNGVVYFDDWDGNVYAVHVRTGALLWTVNLGFPISSTPTLADGLVYVALSPFDTHSLTGGPRQEMVFALSQTDGSTVWKEVLDGTSDAIYASPTVSNGLLFIGIAAGSGQPGVDESDPALQGDIYALQREHRSRGLVEGLGG